MPLGLKIAPMGENAVGLLLVRGVVRGAPGFVTQKTRQNQDARAAAGRARPSVALVEKRACFVLRGPCQAEVATSLRVAIGGRIRGRGWPAPRDVWSAFYTEWGVNAQVRSVACSSDLPIQANLP